MTLTPPEPGTGYDDATKAAVLQHYAGSQSARETAVAMGVHYQTIYRWAEEARQQNRPQRFRCCQYLLDITAPCPACGRTAPLPPH